MRQYFSLLIQDLDGIWAPQFGDYSRRVVEEERSDYCEGWQEIPRKRTKIIATEGSHAAIMAKVAELNAKP